MTDAVEPCDTPRPGPQHWDWRCLVCGWAIADHEPLMTRLRARLRRRLTPPGSHGEQSNG